MGKEMNKKVRGGRKEKEEGKGRLVGKQQGKH